MTSLQVSQDLQLPYYGMIAAARLTHAAIYPPCSELFASFTSLANKAPGTSARLQACAMHSRHEGLRKWALQVATCTACVARHLLQYEAALVSMLECAVKLTKAA